MITHYIIQAIFVLVGLLTLLASLFNWDWFFTKRARLFYAALGCLMIATGVYFFLSLQGIVE